MSTIKRVNGDYSIQTVGGTGEITLGAQNVVMTGDLTVAGNAVLLGNINADRIFNGTSNVEIPTTNGNIEMSVGGVPDVLVLTSTGANVQGYANVAGNITAGNITTSGVIAGNVTLGNIDTTGNISITRDASLGQPTFRFIDTDTTVSDGTVLGAVEWYTSDLSPGGRVTAGLRAIASGVAGNANVQILTSTNGAAATAKVTVDNVGNVGIANTAPLHTLAVSGTMYGSSTLSIVGNVTGGNIATAGLVTATGNITSAANIAGGNLAITSNVTANNLSASTRLTVGAGGISATGNIDGGNLISQGIISATGNLTTTDIFATTVSASGNITGANLNLGGVANTNSVTATTTISAAGNVTGGNVNTSGLVSAGGNVRGGNIVSAGLITAAGNIISGGYFVGDGGFLSNVTAVSNLAVSQLANGATNLTVRASTGPITADVNGVANVFILTDSTWTMTGSMTATGNVVGGNLNTLGIVSAAGNINGGNVNASIGNFSTVIGAANASNLTTGTVPSDRLTGIYTINISGYSSTVSAASQPNITSVGILSSLSVSGNVVGGNLSTAGLITATGNVTAGNVNSLGVVNTSTLAVTSTASVTGNITGGNVNTAGLVSVTGNVNSGAVSATGNVTGGNLITGGLITAVANVNTSAGVLATGNVTGGNINTSGLITATGNILGGNISTSGLVTATGNINTSAGVAATGNVSGNYILGNITFATGYNASKIFNGTSEANIGSVNGNANISIGGTSNVVVVSANGLVVSGTLSASGNVTGGNLLTAGLISATGQITGSQFNGSGAGLSSIPGANVTGTVASATSATTAGTVTTAAQPNITSVGTLSSLAVTGNISGANINGSHFGSGAGLSSLTGANVTGTVANATYATSAGSATSATTAGTVTTNAQPNITSVGTLSSLAVTGNISGGNLSVSTGTVTLGNVVNSNSTGVGNIGSSLTYFNTVFAKATSAQYADLAEKFLADHPYEPGTVLIFGGDNEVTESVSDADHRVAGVVSTDPSYLMNAGLTGDYAVEIALQGRVPCRVIGPVAKGDLMVSAPGGRARATKFAVAGTILGKSLENFDGEQGVITIVVGRD